MTSRKTNSLLITSQSTKRFNVSTQIMKSDETRSTEIGSSLSAERWEVVTSESFFNLSRGYCPNNHRLATMISNKKRSKNSLSDKQVDEIVEKQAADDSAWEKPIQVRRRVLSSRPAKAVSRCGSYRRSTKVANVVVLDSDVADVFTSAESVNQALRALAVIIQQQSNKVRP